jgi:hypothetical protein
LGLNNKWLKGREGGEGGSSKKSSKNIIIYWALFTNCWRGVEGMGRRSFEKKIKKSSKKVPKKVQKKFKKSSKKVE